MAKVPFSKLGLKTLDEIKTFNWEEQEITVKQFVPTKDKLDIMSNILSDSQDDNVFFNPSKLEIYEILNLVFYYTNISFTEKQQEDVLKLYDLIISSGLWDKIRTNLPDSEYNYIHNGVSATIKEIYAYKNSAAGMMESLQENYVDLNDQLDVIQEKVSNPETLNFVKDVVTKLG